MSDSQDIGLRPGATMWAKTGPNATWHPLLAHLLESADAGRFIWDSWLPDASRNWLAEPFQGLEDARSALIWLCGLHDLGKASPAFQAQSPEHAARVSGLGLAMDGASGRAREAPHATTGAALLVRELEALGWSRKMANRWATLIASHHGVFGRVRPTLVNSMPDLVGSGAWNDEVSWFFARVSAFAQANGRLSQWSALLPSVPERMVMAGYIVLADWLASNEAVAPYLSEPSTDYSPSVEAGIVGLGLQPRWQIQSAADDPMMTRFGRAARPVQQTAVSIAQQAEKPGLLLIEAPMGEGKTEAALAAAEVLAAGFGSGGVFVALPTQATSNQMFTRVKAWLEELPGSAQSLVLVHGKAAFNEEYASLPSPSDIGRDDSDSIVPESAAWFRGSKRHLLAPFAVGTVDHLLLAAAKVRFVQLRQLALAGKVVVIDEVHAYDAHMQVFLQTALAWLSALRVPVILLSATLPQSLRDDLLKAYSGEDTQVTESGYPSLTWTAAGAEHSTEVTRPSRSDVSLSVRNISEETLVTELTDLLSEGGCAVVIRNTVRQAQATYDLLRQYFEEEELTLFHARFTQDDRGRIEGAVLTKFGPEGCRPPRHVLVATQVVEQSLDLDFDLMVSDIAPVDLLLQRAGRLHRHPNVQRPRGLEQPTLIVIGDMGTDEAPPDLLDGTRRIYGQHLLLRTVAWLRNRRTLTIPSDIPLAVSAVYGDEDLAPLAWQQTMVHAREEHDSWRDESVRRAMGYALPRPESISDLVGINETHLGPADSDDPYVTASVRGGQASIEVLLLLRDGNSSWRTLDGTALGSPPDTRRTLGAAVRLPSWLTPTALEQTAKSPWTDNAWLRHARIVPLDPEGAGHIGDHVLRYSRQRGLEISHGT